MTKTQKIVYYVLLVLVSADFLFSSYSKLTSDPMQVAGFTTAHLPMWFMYFIGVAELAGVIGLWLPKLQKWAVYGLEIIMVGAIVVTVIFVNIPMALIPLVVGALLWYIMKLGMKKSAAPVMNAAPIA
jgi:uncharacterized membrane protein YphA (DoxX/SURF4 family)